MLRKRLGVMMSTMLLTGMLFSSQAHASSVLLKQGSRGNEVTKVQKHLKSLGLFKYPRITGYYGTITSSAVKQFQKSKGLVVDGIVGKNTYSAMFNSNTKISTKAAPITSRSSTSGVREVQLLDWWTKASNVFSRGSVATIVDVDTRKSFQVKRTYGTNHADVEPLTANDSKIIKQIWGGWSWSRRAIIVQINGQNIAASMAAMPHAGLDNRPANINVSGRSGGYGYGLNLDSVKGNGVDGHMDIHFLNSKTHGSNKVDAAHQSMVKKAANSY